MSETFTQPATEARQYHDTAAASTELLGNTDYVLGDRNIEDGAEYGISAVIIADSAEAAATGDDEDHDEFLIIDVRNAPRYGKYKQFRDQLIDARVDYFLVNGSFDPANGTGFKGLRKGEDFTVGRNNPDVERRFGKMNDTTSRSHFNVRVDEGGRLHIADLGSSNGTRVLSAEQPVVNGYYAPHSERAKQEPKQEPKQEQKAQEAYTPPTAENKVTETPEQEWDRKKQEAVAAGLDQKTTEALARIERDFKSEIPFDIAAGLIKLVFEKGAQGLSGAKAKRELYKRWHPDLHRNAPPEQQKLAESVAKLLEVI